MSNEIVELQEDVSASPLYSEDLAPIPASKRSWSMWDMAAIWVGMAVCIPTYMLASLMITQGISWIEALVIIILGNLVITIPMIANGHAGVKYGIPFPVVGRAAFGTKGIHLASLIRGLVACGWFGIQTWIGGLAFYEIYNILAGTDGMTGLAVGKFVGFFLFWLINVYFIWHGTESIKWLEKITAPILIAIGVLLIGWGASTAGGFGIVLKQGEQLAQKTAVLTQEDGNLALTINPLKDKNGKIKAESYQLTYPTSEGRQTTDWLPLPKNLSDVPLRSLAPQVSWSDNQQVGLKFRANVKGVSKESSLVNIGLSQAKETTFGDKIWSYLLWLTVMVGFWATMAISISDITRYTSTQRNQVMGQFIGLPGTMALFSFVGIFVTCAAVINFDDLLIGEDAPWDPVSLIGKFDNLTVVLIAQVLMLIATLSTNIAANVIAPANAFSNLNPKQISFRTGGIITAIVGIIICPWWLMDEISNFLIVYSGVLGPVLGILICDYFFIRNKELDLPALFKTDSMYSFGQSGINSAAMIALFVGAFVALIGLWVPALSGLYTLSWFTGFIVGFVIYYVLMKNKKH